MTSTWVLIIMLWGGSTSGGVHTSTVEFYNQTDCNEAAQQLLRRAGGERFDIRTVCVEKRNTSRDK